MRDLKRSKKEKQGYSFDNPGKDIRTSLIWYSFKMAVYIRQIKKKITIFKEIWDW